MRDFLFRKLIAQNSFRASRGILFLALRASGNLAGGNSLNNFGNFGNFSNSFNFSNLNKVGFRFCVRNAFLI